MLKIISWNIQQGGGRRISSIGNYIHNEAAQVVILSEFRNNKNGNVLRNKLLQSGYRFQGVTAAATNDNSILIASKMPGDTLLHPQSDVLYANNIIEYRFSALGIIGGYFPHKKKHQLFEYILRTHIEADLPYLIAGDFNSGKNYVDQKGNSFWYQEDLVKWEKAGYLDAFRLVQGDTREYSWYSHQGNGYRYDHMYVHPVLETLIEDCYYLHEAREKGLSDHSPMILTLNIL